MKNLELNTILRGTFAAGAFMLASQGAIGGGADGAVTTGKTETVRVTAPSQEVVTEAPALSADTKQIIERLQRQLEEAFAKQLKAEGIPRIELAVAEVPTRG
jgi:hypothetical protein